MNDPIIRVTPVPDYFNITWMLGSRCNYDCMYCPTELHDMTSRPHDLKTMQQVWKNLYEKTKDKNLLYKISFTGGEVTANKNFLPLIEWLRATYQNISMILITTNGSASLRYYTKLAKSIESISFSTHSEFMNEQDFFDKAKLFPKGSTRARDDNSVFTAKTDLYELSNELLNQPTNVINLYNEIRTLK